MIINLFSSFLCSAICHNQQRQNGGYNLLVAGELVVRLFLRYASYSALLLGIIYIQEKVRYKLNEIRNRVQKNIGMSECPLPAPATIEYLNQNQEIKLMGKNVDQVERLKRGS